jgi:hypothetical protein
MTYTIHNHYYNNLKTLKYWGQQIIGVYKNIGAGKIYKNIGAYKNVGVDKLLPSIKHRRSRMLAQKKVGGDAEELPYC